MLVTCSRDHWWLMSHLLRVQVWELGAPVLALKSIEPLRLLFCGGGLEGPPVPVPSCLGAAMSEMCSSLS